MTRAGKRHEPAIESASDLIFRRLQRPQAQVGLSRCCLAFIGVYQFFWFQYVSYTVKVLAAKFNSGRHGSWDRQKQERIFLRPSCLK